MHNLEHIVDHKPTNDLESLKGLPKESRAQLRRFLELSASDTAGPERAQERFLERLALRQHASGVRPN